MIMDVPVEGAWLEFRGGEAVASGAASNAAALEAFLAIDPGSRRLGEVALVDTSSPVWRSGLFYRNILVDENAACHLGLGAGIVKQFEGAESMDGAGREAAGLNVSGEHTDVMVGSGEVEVFGVGEDGTERPLIKDGLFTF